VLVVAAVVVGVVWYRIGVGGGSEAPRRGASAAAGPAATGGAAATTTTDQRDAIVVHVAGAVATPGVVELPPGSRVIDAVEAAGGAVADADLDRLNLAAKVADGERVLVQRVGDPASAAAGGEPTAGSEDAGSAPGLVNLNTATQRDLEELPGIGPVLAGAIVDERERRGGFRSVQELRDVDGIGEKRFADLADLVTV
jgi:competence protein ComEA